MNHVVLYVGHLYKPFGTQKNWVLKLKRTPEMDSNQLGGNIWGPFQGSFTHLGTSRGLRSQTFCICIYLSEDHSGPYFDLPCQPGQLFWSKMASTGVLHIVQHLLSSSRTSLGYFRPSEVRFSAILPFRTIYSIRQKKAIFFKIDFLKIF